MTLDTVKLSLYKYKIKSFTLMIGKGKKKTKYDVESTLIERMNIIHNYEEECLPFFTVTMTLPTKIYRVLVDQKNANDILVNLCIQKGKFSDGVSRDNDALISYRDAIKGKFHVVIGPRRQDLSQELQEVAENDDNIYGQYASVTVALYSELFFENYDMVINGNLEATTLIDVIFNCLTKAKIKKMLIAPPDNHKVYSQFIITPIPLYEQLYRRCNTYAFFKKGGIVYFDTNRGYIIPAVNKCVAYEPNEYKVTYIILATNSQATNQVGGGYDNTKKKYYVLNGLSINTRNQDDPSTNVMLVNANGKVKKMNKKSAHISEVVVQNEGESMLNSYKKDILESRKAIEIPFKDIDISALTPNKMFTVTAETAKYKKYNGNYRLSGCIHAFEKEGDYFSVTSIASLK